MSDNSYLGATAWGVGLGSAAGAIGAGVTKMVCGNDEVALKVKNITGNIPSDQFCKSLAENSMSKFVGKGALWGAFAGAILLNAMKFFSGGSNNQKNA